MKKIISIVLMVCMLSSLSFIGVSAETEDIITVNIDGEAVLFDVAPQLINGRTMVPLRAIFEALGATVMWNDQTQTVTATKDDTTVKATIGQKTILVNDKLSEMDVSPILIQGRTLVPARFVAEAFNCKVSWDDVTWSVNIVTESDEDEKPVNDNILQYDDNSKNIAETMQSDYIENIEDKLSAGKEHVALITPDNVLLMWGSNEKKQIKSDEVSGVFAPNEIMRNVRKVVLGQNHTLALTFDNKLYAWGDNTYGQTIGSDGSKPIMESVSDIAASDNFSVALNKDGEVYVWGDNSKNQLGLVGIKKIDTPVKVLGNATKVYADSEYFAVYTSDKSLILSNSIQSFIDADRKKVTKSPLNLNDIIIGGNSYKTAFQQIKNVDKLMVSKSMLEIVHGEKTEMYTCEKNHFNLMSEISGIKFISEDYYIENGNVHAHENKNIVIDDVIHYVFADAGTVVVILKDGSVYAWGYDRNGTIGNGKTQKNNHALTPAFVTNLNFDGFDDDKDRAVEMTITDAKLISNELNLSLKFTDENGNVIQPLGEVEIVIHDYHNNLELTEETKFFISSKNYKSSSDAEIEIGNSFLNSFSEKGVGIAKIIFKDTNTYLEAESDKITGFKVSESGSSGSGKNNYYGNYGNSSVITGGGSSSNAMVEYCQSMINQLQKELNNVMMERNKRVFKGGRWVQTYDINKANEIQSEIDYWKAQMNLYK